ncbi:PREDICTED: uncharacterized protein LOC109583620 [Amphimedon queenslandica]|uniref:Uncharacterized protein n=1 Tax=Amphimedon queenslandica TaxID=400682 RepID=A0AAN0JCX7_AMPQE|nr:PREDICTED: uncharacterized protein LOC109583620 [Amphimedon queenslandica]|eukprot:XP_019854601.1 PREDICTED: uncharacterized protein LOC109583620 [Amphimedon queenslandica]
MALHKRWLQVNPQASWRCVNVALKQCKENKLARDIERKTTVSTQRTCNDDIKVLTNANPDPIVAGNPKDILRTHSAKLTDAIATNLYRVTDALYAERLIPLNTKEEVYARATGLNDSRKSSQLVNVLQKQLGASLNPKQFLIETCHVLTKQQHCILTDIATSILHQLGQSIPDNVSSHTVPPLPADDISNTPVTNIRDKLYNLPADVTKIRETKLSVSDQFIDWKGYGLRIKLLNKLSSEITVHATALVGGKLFELPENTILVSVIYAVSTSIPLLMRLELQHCVDLKNHPSMSCYLRFATASINDGSPYKLTLKKGNFKSSASSGYGSFDYNTNCFICILGLKKGTVNGSIDHEIMKQEQKQKGSRKQHKTYQLRKYAQKECQQGKLRKHGQDKQKNEGEVVGKLKTTSIMQQKQKQKGSRKQHKNYQLRKDAQMGYQQAKLRKHANGQDKQKNKGGAVAVLFL